MPNVDDPREPHELVHAAYVFDLDGVVRDFAAESADAGIELALGLAPGGLAQVVFRPELLDPTVTGQQTFEQWYAAIVRTLEAEVSLAPGSPPVETHLRPWREYRGTPIDSTVERIAALRKAGAATFVFTNGTDFVPEELRMLGLEHLFDGLLNSADFGVAKPDPAAYAAAHQAIEEHVGHPVDRISVWFTDDRPKNVEAAREFGWDAELFSQP